jgi:hypothetical protein
MQKKFKKTIAMKMRLTLPLKFCCCVELLCRGVHRHTYAYARQRAQKALQPARRTRV